MNSSSVVALDNGSQDGNSGRKLEALRRQFFVDEDLCASRLEELAV